MMLRLSFALIALHPFFSTYVVGFSAASCRNNYNDNTNIMRSRRTWRRNHHDVIFQLNVAMAVDQTVVDAVPTATSSRSKKKKKQEIKEKSRSYDFISVEEAENALRRERARYEGERSELQRLVDVQSRQIRELSERGMHTTTTTTTTTTGKDKGISDNDAVVDKDTSVQIIVHDSSVTGVINNGKRIRRNSRSNKGSSSSNNSNSNKEENANIMAKMERMEIEFREVLMDNEELTRNFRDQRHQFLAERDDLEDQIKEEQIRLDCARDELHMERAYFETSRRMLERLLDDEQQKVQELEQELLMLLTREQIFSEQKRSLLEQQEQKLRQEYAQTQQKEKESDEGEEQQQQQQQQQRQHEYAQQMQEENVYVYNDSTTDRKESMVGGNPGGFSMLNNNDVHCPLYP